MKEQCEQYDAAETNATLDAYWTEWHGTWLVDYGPIVGIWHVDLDVDPPKDELDPDRRELLQQLNALKFIDRRAELRKCLQDGRLSEADLTMVGEVMA